ncbi:importin beta-like SAD2 homolog [Solanum pennellii]|uniref:Importin beta-like SAD2 homolog n=1 Tax=Solanum pennellii TaxID=28526 RepID=A0ABM1FW58_SOLPN|nr:importin beta-like SAD2 homolog [Solanum pennellii]
MAMTKNGRREYQFSRAFNCFSQLFVSFYNSLPTCCVFVAAVFARVLPQRHHLYVMEIHQIAQLLNQTLSPNDAVINAATDALDHLSTLPEFPFTLLSIAIEGENGGQKVAAATYLKNFTRRNVDSIDTNSGITKEFRDAFVRALLQAEPMTLKILVEAFRSIIAVEFVKKDAWPELVPELRSVIQRSDLIDKNPNSEWKTINALTILHSLIRPFQYFLNPKLVKEPVPPQLELISREILVPLLAVFHLCTEKVSDTQHTSEVQTETILLMICKCIYFAVKSHMPSALAPLLPSICQDLIRILNSLSFDGGLTCKDGYSLLMKTAKRSLLIFCALVSRHRKFADKLMPDMVKCVSEIAKHSTIINKLDPLSERTVSLAFDVISRVLETGPGWRLVSPHFSSLLNSAIFPALVKNEKDTIEWEEDPDEYIRKNLPSDLEEISGLRDDLFTARKSALNLLGVISISKGLPVKTSTASSKRKKGEKNKRKGYSSMGELLVLPFLSKFPVPTDNGENTVNEYYGVLMAYSSLLDFLTEQSSGFTDTLVRNRVLPLYETPSPQPYLIATANWVLGELASCLSEGMSADIYSSLVKALQMSDMGDVSCYPVRVTAAAAIAQLVENEYMPPEWLPLLQVVCHRIRDEEEDSSIYFQLLSTMVEVATEKLSPHIPDIVCLLVKETSKNLPLDLEPWPQMVEQCFATLAVIAQCWENSASEENEQDDSSQLWLSGQTTMMRAFSDLLQHAWLRSAPLMEHEVAFSVPPSSCVDDCSTLLGFILQGLTQADDLLKLKVAELMLVWSYLIADWHAWEEMEDLSTFNCIKKAVSLDKKFAVKNFLVGKLPLPPAPPVPQKSILEGIGAFITEAFSQYPSAVWRASSCVHILLHSPSYLPEGEGVKQSLVISLCQAAFSRFREIRNQSVPLWNPLLLAIASCYLCFPDIVEKIIEGIEHEGFTSFLSALAIISTSRFDHSLSSVAEIKLVVMALAQSLDKLIGRQNEGSLLLHDSVASLMEAFLKFKELEEEEEEDEESEDQVSGDEETEDDDDDEDSEDDELEETELEFLERYAKTAAEMENGTIVEEGDTEDQELEIELGCLEDVDLENTVLLVIQRYHQVLLRLQLPPELFSSFLEALPECKLYFQQAI